MIRRRLPSWILVAGVVWSACSAEPPQTAESVAAVESVASEEAVGSELQRVDPPSGPGAMAPNLAVGRDGVALTWLEPLVDGVGLADGTGHSLFVSTLDGERWTPAQLITSGDGFFANWADLPGVVEATDGTRYAHWLSKLGGDTYAYGAALARSTVGATGDGEAWEEIGLLHDDASPTEHGFVSYASLATGGIQAFWLDGRAMMDGGAMQLRTTRLDGGAPATSEVLDRQVCECCATDATSASSGPVVVYRDRSTSEVRDIAVMRATPEGWSESILIHDDGWQINGCPVNGPAIAADGEQVVVAWFSAAENRPRVQVVFSSDAAVHFGEAVVVDDEAPLGRVDVEIDAQGSALVSWLGSTESGAEVRWRRISVTGERGPLNVIASTTAERSAGVPRMVRSGDQLVFVWVEASDPSELRSGLVPLG